MYCIINQSNDIIAGDQEFFSLMKSENLMELYGQIANGVASITFSTDEITIAYLDDVTSYPIRIFALSGLLSQASIIEILQKEQINTNLDNSSETLQLEEDKPLEYVVPTLEEDDLILNDVDSSNLILDSLTLDKDNIDKPIEAHPEHGDEIPSLEITTEDSSVEENVADTEALLEHDQEIIGLLGTIEDNSLQENVTEIDEIEIDVPTISQQMELSQAEYISFLQEYIQTAQSLKVDLEGTDEDKKQSAINFIAHLSDVLCLPTNISSVILDLISSATPEHIDKFYNTIDKISINRQAAEQPTEDEGLELNRILFVDAPQDSDEKIEVNESEVQLEKEITPKKVRSIDLSDIAPVKVDFILNESVRELSLPGDIVKEFITYFIEQSHIEIDNILDAYEEGDVGKVKKIAHMLKGVASNLYIIPLADSLYELQYNEDIKQVAPLVKKYWAQFISFENLMNNA
jgi:HPt (histidine-containing phosphotransfer) domain-containing protein